MRGVGDDSLCRLYVNESRYSKVVCHTVKQDEPVEKLRKDATKGLDALLSPPRSLLRKK